MNRMSFLSVILQSMPLSPQDMRCGGEMLRGTWGHVVTSVPAESFQVRKRTSLTCPGLLIVPHWQVCWVLLQAWMPRAALCCAVGRGLRVNSCFLSRWSGNCCAVWEGPGSSPFRQTNTTSGFLFISLCSHSLSTSLPSPSF